MVNDLNWLFYCAINLAFLGNSALSYLLHSTVPSLLARIFASLSDPKLQIFLCHAVLLLLGYASLIKLVGESPCLHSPIINSFFGQLFYVFPPHVCPTCCDPMGCIACQAPLSVGFSRQEYWSEWVAIPFSRGSSPPRDWTWVSCIADDSLPTEQNLEHLMISRCQGSDIMEHIGSGADFPFLTFC